MVSPDHIYLDHTSGAEASRPQLDMHDMFAVPFTEVAEVVGRSPESVRQLASRARQRGGHRLVRP